MKRSLFLIILFSALLLGGCTIENPQHEPIYGGYDGFSTSFAGVNLMQTQQTFKYAQPAADVKVQPQPNKDASSDYKDTNENPDTGFDFDFFGFAR